MVYEENINEINFIPYTLLGGWIPSFTIGYGIAMTNLVSNSFFALIGSGIILSSSILGLVGYRKMILINKDNEKHTTSYLAKVIKDKPLKNYHLLTIHTEDLNITHKIQISNEHYNTLNNRDEFFIQYDIYSGKKRNKTVQIATNPRLASTLYT